MIATHTVEPQQRICKQSAQNPQLSGKDVLVMKIEMGKERHHQDWDGSERRVKNGL